MPSASPISRPLAGLVPAADLPLLTGFHDYLLNGPTPHSLDTTRTYMGRLATYFRLDPAASTGSVTERVSKPALTMVLSSIPAHRSSARANTFFAIKALARYLADLDLLDEGMAAAIAAMRIRRGAKPKRAHLTADEIGRVLRRIAANPGYNDDERLLNLTLVAALALTGLRNSELCRLKVEDVNMEVGLIHVIHGKGGKTRTVGLPARLAPLLRLYLDARPATTSPYLLVNANGGPLTRDLVIRKFQRVSKIAGSKVTAHSLRRSFATDVAHNKGVSLDKLQLMLGHSDIVTTRNYVQTSGSAVALEMRGW